MAYCITENCIGCTLCAKNCPVNAISGQPRQRHEIDPGRCVSCSLCGRLCPKSAIADDRGVPVQKLPREQWSIPKIDRSRCVGCSLCVEDCPKFCLRISDPVYHGDIHTVAELFEPEDCIGCGICARRCPIEAITMAGKG